MLDADGGFVKKTEVLYSKGNYKVIVVTTKKGVRKYATVNTDTDVQEHTSTVLFECMRAANMFHDEVDAILNPKKWKTEEAASPLQGMFNFPSNKAN